MELDLCIVLPPMVNRDDGEARNVGARTAVAVVRPVGELDLSTADEFKGLVCNALESHPGVAGLVIDLSGVGLADSSGLGALNACRLRMAERGGRTVLCCPTPQVSKVLPLTALDRLMPVVATRDEAVALVMAQAGPGQSGSDGQGVA